MSICKVLNFFVPPHSSAPGVRKSIKGKGTIGKTAIQRFSYFLLPSGLYSPTSLFSVGETVNLESCLLRITIY